jgi:hypothetical protein
LIIAAGFFIFNQNDIGKYLAKILYYDSKTFQYRKIHPSEYFLEPTNIVNTANNVEDNNNNTFRETSRELKPNVVNNNEVLQLKENIGEAVYNKEDSVKMNNNFIAVNKNAVNPESPIPSTLITKGIISIADYNVLTTEDSMIYDKRSHFTFLKDSLSTTHSLFSLILKRSLKDPASSRIISFIFSTSLVFMTNAFFMSDSYIEDRINNNNRVSQI